MVPVFYCQDMVPADHESLASPSAGKPKKVVDDWLDHDLKVCICPVIQIDQSLIRNVHKYADSIFKLQCNNGFGTISSEVNRSLLYTVGSFHSAVQHVSNGKSQVACSPTSGFHHAGYEECGGFCTFNGLIVAASYLLRRKTNYTIGILDMDHHYGDGTNDLIDTLGIRDSIEHQTGFHGDPELILDTLPDVIEGMGADILFYQAGADQHVDDPLGGLFDTEQMRRRDRIVFKTCKNLKIGCIWNLAGGYQENFDNVLEIHRNTMNECIDVYYGEV